ncbi:hypothetical protein ACFQU7_41730 [Pseudoroseomonas wenyumeiae]
MSSNDAAGDIVRKLRRHVDFQAESRRHAAEIYRRFLSEVANDLKCRAGPWGQWSSSSFPFSFYQSLRHLFGLSALIGVSNTQL